MNNNNNINRDNYETFFLLYTDNELSVTERKAVDEFVYANPDLQEELVMLQQSTVKPDTITFDNKELLLRHEAASAGMQEKLLLHLDHELTAAERNETDRLIKANAGVKKEWDLLKQTKLSPDNAIVFKDKQSLYRKEPRKVVAFPWLRVAAAAFFIGFGLLGSLVYLHKGTKAADDAIAKTVPVKSTNIAPKPYTSQTVAPLISSAGNEEVVANTMATTKKTSIARPAGTRQPAEKIFEKSREREIQPVALTKQTNNLPAPHSENINRIVSNETIPAYVTHEKQTNNISNPVSNAIAKNTGIGEPANVYASAAAYTDNTEDNNNNRVLFMSEEKIKKTKLGGFFRKVKRVLERSANIKPGGNNIKVANMEFAIQ